jgi:hypothetical protein
MNSSTKPIIHCAPAAEQAAIGSLILDSQVAWPTFSKLNVTRRWFYDLRMAEIYEICRELKSEGRGIDIVTIISRAEQRNAAKIDWQLLTTLPDMAATALMVESYLLEVREAFRKRELTEAVRMLQKTVDAPEAEIAATLVNIESLVRFIECDHSNGLPPIVPVSEFMAAPLPEPPQIIGGVLYKSAKLVLSGASKAGKTWLFIDLATAVALGAEWLGLPTAKGRVLYLNTELQEQVFQRRVSVVCEAKGISTDSLSDLHLWNLRGKPSAWDKILPKIRTRVKDEGYSLIIVDPLYKLYGALKENSAEDMGILTNALGELAEESGAAIAIATHHSKGNQAGKEAIDRISGSGVIARDADALIDFSANEVEHAYSVATKLRSFKPMDDFAVSWRFPLFQRDENIDPAKLKQAAGRPRIVNPVKLLAAIAENTAENPISVSAWASLTETKRQTLSEYLPDFRQKGWIKTMGEGSSARQFITDLGLQYINEKAA